MATRPAMARRGGCDLTHNNDMSHIQYIYDINIYLHIYACAHIQNLCPFMARLYIFFTLSLILAMCLYNIVFFFYRNWCHRSDLQIFGIMSPSLALYSRGERMCAELIIKKKNSHNRMYMFVLVAY